MIVGSQKTYLAIVHGEPEMISGNGGDPQMLPSIDMSPGDGGQQQTIHVYGNGEKSL